MSKPTAPDHPALVEEQRDPPRHHNQPKSTTHLRAVEGGYEYPQLGSQIEEEIRRIDKERIL